MAKIDITLRQDELSVCDQYRQARELTAGSREQITKRAQRSQGRRSKAPGCYPFTAARSVSNQTSYRIVLWHISTGCGEGTKLLTLNPGTYTDNTGSTATGIEVHG
ncbi:hypothetical protein OG244_17590 [Streptomyces brevispora]|uniref:hypothetical protein n=1 Tax=Streptomyces brevispora TaxID=887462 RepID=UPI002E2FD148|nr:hypothetical protein [Streptomyces brevispora]